MAGNKKIISPEFVDSDTDEGNLASTTVNHSSDEQASANNSLHEDEDIESVEEVKVKTKKPRGVMKSGIRKKAAESEYNNIND